MGSFCSFRRKSGSKNQVFAALQRDVSAIRNYRKYQMFPVFKGMLVRREKRRTKYLKGT